MGLYCLVAVAEEGPLYHTRALRARAHSLSLSLSLSLSVYIYIYMIQEEGKC